jgi:prepilin-type processing-associated H-X9-DG protein
MWFNSGTVQQPEDISDPGYVRSISLVKRSAEVVMLVEASDPNWMDQKQSTEYPKIWLKRLGARHGKKTADGLNAKTHFAFFDGHVGLFDSEPYTRRTRTGGKDNALIDYYTDTIFYLNKQRGK